MNKNISNNNYNEDNYSHSKSNYIYQNNQNIKNKLFNQESYNAINTNNSIPFKSPLSTNINYEKINLQKQFGNSTNISNPYEDFRKITSTDENSNNNRDSKQVKIKTMTKKNYLEEGPKVLNRMNDNIYTFS